MQKRVIPWAFVVAAGALAAVICGRPVGAAEARPVEDVIKENLASWRFKPGEEVFVNRSARSSSQVALTADPQGRLYIAWVEGYGTSTRINAAASADGKAWKREAELDPQVNYVPALAAAANGAGEVVLAWAKGVDCWTAERSADGVWGKPAMVGEPAPATQRSTYGSLALTAGAGDEIWLLALVGPTGEPPPLRLWTRDRGGAWQAAPVPTFGPYTMQALLGFRDGLVSIARGRAVRQGQAQTWDSLFELPWEPLPPQASRTLCLWARPTALIGALTLAQEPVRGCVHLTTSPNLEHWSKPAFLGFTARIGSAGVAATERGIYVATTFEPWWSKLANPQGDEKVVWTSPRVFLVDASLKRDTDGDGLTDIAEEWLLTDPSNPDTDGDRWPDSTDLNALAKGRPDNDEARIRQAIYDTQARVSDAPLIFVSPERQAVINATSRVLCLTKEEAEAYRVKFNWPLTYLEIEEIKINAQDQTATAKWGLYTAPLAAHGGTAKLQKLAGRWTVTDRGESWIS